MMSWRRGLSISFFLFVVSTMISQSAMDAFAILSGIFLIGLWFKEKKSFPLFPKTGVEWPFLLFLVAVILSFVLNWNQQTLALERIIELKWILNFYLIVTILRVLNPSWGALQKVQIFIWISALFAILAPILGYDLLTNINSVERPAYVGFVRAGGFFSNPMTFAHLHALFFFLLVGLAFHFWIAGKKEVWGLATLTGVLGLALLLSLTRGVWISVFCGLVLTGFLLNRRWGFYVLFGAVIFGLSVFLLVPSIQDRVLQFMAADSYDSERVWIWRANWQIFLDHPLFGIGYGENTLALREYYAKVGAPQGLLISHSHNQYLHLLAGLGVFGLFSYLGIVLLVFIQSWKLYFNFKGSGRPIWQQGILLGSLGGQLSFLVGGLTESNFEHAKVRYVLLIVWAIPLWLKGKDLMGSTSQSNQK